MGFLHLLENFRLPILDVLMQVITEFGSELIFLAAVLVLYWCIDKKKAYYLMAVGFFGTVLNQFLKIFCRIPRPWVRDPEFTIVESARAGATGYSFPSGHSQTAVSVFGTAAVTTKKRWVRAASVALMVLVPFSRMYLGVHTPADVLVGGLSALVLVLVLKPIVYSEKQWAFPALLGVMAASAGAFVAYMELKTFPADVDAENLFHASKNAYSLLGALLGFGAAYFFDLKKLNFPVDAVWWCQILKVVVGLVLTVVIKSLLKEPLNALFGGHFVAHGIRYFLVVVFAGMIWPMSFRWFQMLGGQRK